MRDAFFVAVLSSTVLMAACGGDDSGDDAPFMPGVPGAQPGTPGTQPPPPGDNMTGVTCGATMCAVGQQCVNGVCATPCTTDAECPGAACCNSFCADTSSDRLNCGGCGNACGATEMCTGGTCIPAMCSGTPGAPVLPPTGGSDAGVEDDAGVPDMSSGGPAPAVIGENGCPPNEECAGGPTGNTCQCGSGPGCPPDQSCSPGGMCMCGSGPGCATGETCCGETCVNFQTDDSNCGACGEVCTGGSACAQGVCTCPNATDTPCDDGCFDTRTDASNCGACGVTCAEGASCNNGVCECDTDGEEACDGVCVPLDDNANCGACGNACEAPSNCGTPGDRPLGCYCDNFNQVPCGGVCVDLGTNTNCSECGDTCEAPTTMCRDNACACPDPDEVPCGDECVDLDATRSASATPIENCGECGLTCLANADCQPRFGESKATCGCPGDGPLARYCETTPDNYECIDTAQTNNCGACGRACITNSACQLDAGGNANDPTDYGCVCLDEDSDKTHCDGIGCVDTQTDGENCGTCGNECPSSSTCEAGNCECNAAGETICLYRGEPICADLDTDERACGTCGNVCDEAAGEQCCGGTCQPATFFQTTDNCGSCGTVCNGSCPPPGLFQPEPDQVCRLNSGTGDYACACP